MEAVVNIKATPHELNLIRMALVTTIEQAHKGATLSKGIDRQTHREVEAECSQLLNKLGG